MFDSFPFYNQLEAADCGPTCLRIISRFHGKSIRMQKIKENCPLEKDGVSLKGLSLAAEAIGFRTTGVKIPFSGTDEEGGLVDVQLPCIAYWKPSHYLVIHRIEKEKVFVADPAVGKISYSKREFEKKWLVDGDKGILLLLETTPEFYSQDDEKEARNFTRLYAYLRPHRVLLGQIILGLLVSSIFSLIFPFLTQSMVDQGIGNHDIGVVYLILLGQIVLFVSSTVVSLTQNWLFLYIGVRVSVDLIHDFLIKLISLPVSFFNRRRVGDLLQRIDDHQRINSFITSSTLGAIFSIVNLITFSIILFNYSVQLFLVYWMGSILYTLWILLFLKQRKILDYKYFEIAASNQSKLIEIIQGIQEIKLQNSQWKRRWQWTSLQAKAFKVRMKSLLISQVQTVGAGAINQGKNIFISFLAAKSVIDGEISLGMMLAVQYIIGQINAPLESMIGFVQGGQSALIGFERLSEVHSHKNEEPLNEIKVDLLDESKDIYFNNVSFKYGNEQSEVVKDNTFTIPGNKVTAIVGSSGSGKTTLIKLMLGFYRPTSGMIKIGEQDLRDIRLISWRSVCGAVMQDGYLFQDTIAHNIAEGSDNIENEKLFRAAKAANVDTFTHNLYAGLNTTIGENGASLSQGQKQRILIARAIYKDPKFIFFDEATNALDSTNELSIMQNLEEFYQGRTVVIAAHRLSTVKKADQILVINDGYIVEKGTHSDLLKVKGHYFKLISNQLELNER